MAKSKKHPVRAHERRPPVRKAPMPASNEFSPAQEQAMRMGQRQQNMAPPEPDADDMGGM